MKAVFKYVIILSVCLAGTRMNKATAQDVSLSTYSGQTTITASNSITLLPGFVIPTGSNVQIFIGAEPTQTPTFSADHSYTVITTVKIPGITDASQLAGKNAGQINQQVIYLDGTGRHSQEIQIEGSAGGNDIITAHAYDIFGRETKAYLPYTSGNALGSYRATALNGSSGYSNSDQAAFYQTPPPGVTAIPTGQVAYEESRFDNSPLNHVLEQGAAGLSWQIGSGHTKSVDMGTNTSSDPVVQWDITSTGATSPGYIPNGLLVKNITTDENQHTVWDYKDNDGRVICRKTQLDATTWLETDYVYDDLGNLRYVIPPLPTSVGAVTSFAESDNVFVNLMYGYHYDEKQRVVEKKVPGQGWEYMVYNKNDQQILSQDSRQKTAGIWLYQKYDAAGNIVMTGEYQDASSRTTLQGNADAYSGALWEGFTNGTDNQGYSAATYPVLNTGNSKILTAYYYNTYNITGNTAVNPNVSVFAAPNSTIDSLNKNPQGLVTAVKTSVQGTNDFLISVLQYDQYNRPVKIIKQTYTSGAALANQYDVVETQYNFDSSPCKSTRNSYSPSVAQLTIVTKNAYDHSGRPLSVRQSYNGAQDVIISSYVYNELGQVVTKNLGSTDGTNYLQYMDYGYNARGWLTRINNPNNLTDEHHSNQRDAFGMQLDYDQPNSAYGGTAQYNGNVSTMSWQTAQSQVLLATGQTQEVRGYAITYDMLNRVTNAYYKAGSGNDQYNEQIGYDVLGNITNLSRRSGAGYLNQLTYNYGTGTNYSDQLLNVTDAGTEGYNDTYTYNENGAVNTDSKKQVTQTVFNDAGLPQQVTFGTGKIITYHYTGTGEKVERIITINGTVAEERSYNTGIEYVGNQVDNIATAEGRALFSSSTGTVSFEYYLRDQLGNVRAVVGDKNNNGTFDVATDLVQMTDYYAFGREIGNGLSASGPPENYKYNGKEYQADLNMYDYGARFYDPVIGRWSAPDPLAGLSRRFSTYTYVENNPFNRTDPDGMYDQALLDQWSDEALDDAGFDDIAKSHGVENARDHPKWANAVNGGGRSDFGIQGHMEYYAMITFNYTKTYTRGHEDQAVTTLDNITIKDAGSAFVLDNDGPPTKKKTIQGADGAGAKTDNSDSQYIDYARLLSGSIAAGNVLINKSALSALPKWFVGNYGRAIVMPGAKNYTSVLSIQLRRLGWEHGGRIIGGAANAIYIGTTVYENVSYEVYIIQGKQNFDQVQSHYDNISVSPMFWLYKRIEPWLINLGK